MVASLAAAVVLLVSFVLIEMRSSHPLLPMRVLADRNRSGAYLIMLCIATGLFGVFFFLTLFMQTVLGYSAIQSGIAFLPFAVGVVIASALASRLVARIGPRPLIVAGAAAVAGGMFWFSRLTEHAGYAGQLLGPMLVTSCGLGLVFVPLSLVALHNVAEQDSGVASSLLNTGQQVGGAIGLAVLGTVAWSTVANTVRTPARPSPTGQPARPAARAARGARPGHRVFPCVPRRAGIALLALLIAIATIRVSRQELTGAVPAPQRRRRSPRLCSSTRTEPPSPRQFVLAGSASRHESSKEDCHGTRVRHLRFRHRRRNKFL